MGEIKKTIGRDEESTLLLPKDGGKKKKAELKAKKAKNPAKKKVPAK
jgi:hypothetical protein